MSRPVGATAGPAGVDYWVWAPAHQRVRAEIAAGAARRQVELARAADGFFAGSDPAGKAGDRYRYLLGEAGAEAAPDPASRWQPDGVFGPSVVVDPGAYVWRHPAWRRPPFRGRIIYELHIGAFTSAGTFRAAIGRLGHLARLGINTIEIMPVADFPGRWNWGYDGVMLFAPARCYGAPDDLRALIDAAHGEGLAVILDVVYNHTGPAGSPLAKFSRDYFHSTSGNAWGQSFNLDGENSAPVREFFLQNAAAWLDEFRLDGLRLDATHAIADRSPRHLCAEIAALAHARGAWVVAEDERNEARVISAAAGAGWGADAVWADDFHHWLHVALTGRRESYFAAYAGTPAEGADLLAHGWKYRGQNFAPWGRARGTPSQALPPERFVVCLSNHDQVGNRPRGERVGGETAAEAYRAAAMLLCLVPYTPMLFMGQEWSASSPFLFFTDHDAELGEKIEEGRRREFSAAYAGGAAPAGGFPRPQAETTFTGSKLDWAEADGPGHRGILALHAACLALRNGEEIFRNPPREFWSVRAADGLLALRWSPSGGGGWLLLLRLAGGPAPKLEGDFFAPAPDRTWQPVLCSNEIRFGGSLSALSPPPATFATAAAWLLRESPPAAA